MRDHKEPATLCTILAKVVKDLAIHAHFITATYCPEPNLPCLSLMRSFTHIHTQSLTRIQVATEGNYTHTHTNPAYMTQIQVTGHAEKHTHAFMYTHSTLTGMLGAKSRLWSICVRGWWRRTLFADLEAVHVCENCTLGMSWSCCDNHLVTWKHNKAPIASAYRQSVDSYVL